MALSLAAVVLNSSLPRLNAWASGKGSDSESQRVYAPARLSERVTVNAAGRGAPYVSLSDGRELMTAYEGVARAVGALESGSARTLSLASADFDADGVPDLVTGHAVEGGGAVAFMRGNADAIHPNAPEAKRRRADGHFADAPFLSPARVSALPAAADFLGAGDFDADGHFDIVAADKGGASLRLLPGDGRGGFGAPREVGLPGGVTALAVGEINRADGLADVVVGVTSGRGGRVLVFEGPGGALRAEPEALEVSAPASALALGQLDESYEYDLAVAAGRDLVLFRGRDRKLSLDAERRKTVGAARAEWRSFDAPIISVAAGDFGAAQPGPTGSLALLTAGGRVEVLGGGAIAAGKRSGARAFSSWPRRALAAESGAGAAWLIAAKVSSGAGDDLIVAGEQLRLLAGAGAGGPASALTLNSSGAPAAVLPMRLNGDALSDLVVSQSGKPAPDIVNTTAALTLVVTKTAEGNDGICNADCSLREAVNVANANPGPDAIVFNIPTTDPGFDGSAFTIKPFFALPTLSGGGTAIDGSTQTSFTGNTNAAGPEVVIDGSLAGAGVVGINVTSASNTVNGLVVNRFGGAGIVITGGATGNVVTGCFVGTNSAGAGAAGNGVDGVHVTGGAANNRIGGTAAAARNVISGNARNGVMIQDTGLNNSNNIVQGNFVGTNATGAQVLPNEENGIQLSGQVYGSLIGGTTGGARNVISGNKSHNIFAGSTGAGATNLVQGNFIGTDASGTVALGNDNVFTGETLPPDGAPGSGVRLFTSSPTTIGGTVASARNLISGNGELGISIAGDNHLVQGNYIGTDSNGSARVLNGTSGIGVQGVGNVIGGVVNGAGNLVSGNQLIGIALNEGASDTVIQGNLVGTNASGTAALANGRRGVRILNASRNLIGGTVPGARNVISGNRLAGVFIYGGPTDIGGGESRDNFVQGNFIGTDVSGTAALGNSSNGVSITIAHGGATNTIGGPTVEARNIISGNLGRGIIIGSASEFPGRGGSLIVVQNNYIGTDVTGQSCLGNALDGVLVDAESTTNRIQTNLIACNGGSGVVIPENPNPGVRIEIDANSIYSNAALGIDLGAAGVTPNDPLDSDGGANLQQNFPVAAAGGAGAFVSKYGGDAGADPLASGLARLTLQSAPSTTYSVRVSFASACQNSQATTPLVPLEPKRAVMTDAQGNGALDYQFEFPGAATSGFLLATATDPVGNTSEFSPCLAVSASPTTPSIQLAQAAYQFPEAAGSAAIVVTRAGDTSAAAAVDYRTADLDAFTVGCADAAGAAGNAYARCDFATSVGTVTFAAGEASKTVSVPLIDDGHDEGSETFQLLLSNAAGAALGSLTAATVTLTDDDAPGAPNPVTSSNFNFFVRQQYLDFLSREPDAGGFNAWLGVLQGCPNAFTGPAAPSGCDRIFVSGDGFFRSVEFQLKGAYVFRFYKAAFNRLPEYTEIVSDMSFVAGQTAAEVFARKAELAERFAGRQEFVTAYGGMTNQQYVNLLMDRYSLQHVTTPDPAAPDGDAKVTLTRQHLTSRLGLPAGDAASLTRAKALRAIADSDEVGAREFDNAFVAMQYYGYLRRKPEPSGYEAWLGVLRSGDTRTMVNGFLNSAEYQLRFGQP